MLDYFPVLELQRGFSRSDSGSKERKATDLIIIKKLERNKKRKERN